MEASAPYMAWAKSRPEVAIDLAISNILGCSIADLDGAERALDFAGRNDNGYPPLVEGIANRYDVIPDRVATAIGTSGANFLTALALVGPGDDVLIEQPAYDPLLAVPRALGANVVRFHRRFEDRFAIDPDRVRHAMTPATRLVIITQPHNPSGGFTPDEDMAVLAQIAARNGATLLVDEVYLDAARGCGARPAAHIGDNVVSTNSLTKSYGLAPLRCGWAIASPTLAERIRRARDLVDGTGCIPVERLSVLAFEQIERLAARTRAILQPNVAAFRRFLEETPALQGFVQHGTVAFPRLRSKPDATAFAAALVQQHGIAVVPGVFFEAPAHFRIGLGVAPEVLASGLKTLSTYLRQ